MFKKILKPLALALFFTANSAVAETTPDPVLKFAKVLKEQYGHPYTIVKIDDGTKFWQISFGPNVVFITTDGNHVLHGELFNVSKGVNYTEQAKLTNNLNAVSKLSKLITYKASPETYEIWVFSDTHCPYCKRFHEEIPKLNASGVTVHYIPFPLQGEGSKGFDTASAILCSVKPTEKFDYVISTLSHLPSNPSCEGYVKNGIKVATNAGISSTPSIILPNGMVAKGAYQEHELIPILKKIKKEQSE